MVKIALDCGHGLRTPGKQCPDGIKEWELSDKVRDKVVQKLSSYDCEIIFPDNDEGNVDESLSSRLNMYIKTGVDAAVSIHHNALKGTWCNATGCEVWVDRNNTAADMKLAEAIYSRLSKYTGLKGRGIKKENWYVINQNKIPAVLVEGGFMDGIEDYKIITSDAGQEGYANAVAEGLIEFLGLKKKTNSAPTTAPSQKPVPTAPAKKSIDEIAKEVIAGKWGNGNDRKIKLTAAGYNYSEVQKKVNEIVTGKKTTTSSTKVSSTSSTKNKSITEIANEVIAGKWGNGADRKKKLTAAGYNYSEVQKKVNELLR